MDRFINTKTAIQVNMTSQLEFLDGLVNRLIDREFAAEIIEYQHYIVLLSSPPEDMKELLAEIGMDREKIKKNALKAKDEVFKKMKKRYDAHSEYQNKDYIRLIYTYAAFMSELNGTENIKIVGDGRDKVFFMTGSENERRVKIYERLTDIYAKTRMKYPKGLEKASDDFYLKLRSSEFRLLD